MSRTLVIGDIHGGFRALDALIKKAQPTFDDHLIFLGDYVDGWSESRETIDYLIDLEQDYHCIFIKGNHDDLCLQWLINRSSNETWLDHGGLSTQKSYQHISKRDLAKHIRFLKALKNYYINDSNQLFVHAGFTNLHGPSREYFPEMLYWDRTLWETAIALNPEIQKNSALYPKRFLNFDEIYIGHTPVTRIGQNQPVQAANIWNMDTGAAFTGPLSMMDIHTKEIFQTKPVFKFYPGEKGRN